MNAPPPGDREEAARARRDRWALRLFLGACALLLGAYAVADAHGIVPRELSVRWRTQQRGRLNLDGRYTEFDPDLCLGIAIGDTRYRFNYASYHAIVTRPLFGVRRWVIPEEVRYEGDVFTVTITLGDKYPRVPPRAVMNTPIFHPNICSNGAICVACLRRSWNQTVTIHQLLEEIVHALRHPNPDDELSLEAANMMKSDPKKFELVVREQVAKNRAQRGV